MRFFLMHQVFLLWLAHGTDSMLFSANSFCMMTVQKTVVWFCQHIALFTCFLCYRYFFSISRWFLPMHIFGVTQFLPWWLMTVQKTVFCFTNILHSLHVFFAIVFFLWVDDFYLNAHFGVTQYLPCWFVWKKNCYYPS